MITMPQTTSQMPSTQMRVNSYAGPYEHHGTCDHAQDPRL